MRKNSVTFEVDGHTADRLILLSGLLDLKVRDLLNQAVSDVRGLTTVPSEGFQATDRQIIIGKVAQTLGAAAYVYSASEPVQQLYSAEYGRQMRMMQIMRGETPQDFPEVMNFDYTASIPVAKPFKQSVWLEEDAHAEFTHATTELDISPPTAAYASTLAVLDRAETHLSDGVSAALVSEIILDYVDLS